jgi:hypothetical protein
VRLVDEKGGTILWNPRLGRARDGMSKLDAYLNGILAGSTKSQRAQAPTDPEPAEQPHSRQQGHDR